MKERHRCEMISFAPASFTCFVLLWLMATAGCDSQNAVKLNKSPASTAENNTGADSVRSAAAGSSATDFRMIRPQELQAVLNQHKGNVILVDFWATWCVPCVEGLPKAANLAKKYRDHGFDVVTVAMDDKLDDETDAQFHERLLSALAPHAALFTSLLSRVGGSEEAMLEFQIDEGALPHYRIYGRDGKLLKTFPSGDPDRIWKFSQIEAAVAEAVANR